MAKEESGRLLAQNKKARHVYEILDTIEAGLVLSGTEIKSVRKARINLKDGYARIRNGEVWLENVHISPYEQGNIYNHDPLRNRKLLMHKKQINKLIGQVKTDGVTLVPLKVYIRNGFAKVLIGVARGKKNYDKRESLKRKEQKRDVARALKERNR
jgi:SsrA-binding protein